MKDIDWSRAPKGTTGAMVADFAHSRGRGWVDFVPGAGRKETYCQGPGFWIYHQRPVEWDGTGLPPVGTVCEVRTKVGGWGEAEIKYQGRAICVWLWVRPDNPDQVEWAESPEHMEFRPIRTPEQIAAEERESELNRMVATVSMLDKGWARKICAGLYDAGYRKQVASK